MLRKPVVEIPTDEGNLRTSIKECPNIGHSSNTDASHRATSIDAVYRCMIGNESVDCPPDLSQ
jgi:hypothetical protein